MKLVCCFTSSTLLNGFCFSVYSITETIDETLHAIYFEELYYRTRRKSNQKLVRSTINCPTMLATSGGTTGDVVADLIASSSVHLFLESQYDVIWLKIENVENVIMVVISRPSIWHPLIEPNWVFDQMPEKWLQRLGLQSLLHKWSLDSL